MKPSSEALRRHLPRLAFSALLFAVVVVLGQVPLGLADDEALLRLSLRTAEGYVEVCRDRTAEELAALPAHMREPRVCDRHPLAYRLRARVGGREIVDRRVEPAGLWGDRPPVIDEIVALPPGRARVAVEFVPDLATGTAGEIVEAAARLPRYRMDRSLRLEAGRVALVMVGEDGRDLVVVQ